MVQARDLDKRRLSGMLLKLYELVDELLALASEGKTSGRSKVDELTASAEEYRGVIASQATLFIARYQPLAEDLVWAESVISIAYDLYRVARYAREIVMVSEYAGNLRDSANSDALESLEIARIMLRESMEAFVEGRKDLIENVFKRDDEVDRVYHKYLKLLGGDYISCRDAVSLLLVRHVERIADHATYIARTASRLLFY